MIPNRTPFFLPIIYPSLIWRMPATKNEIYLTFDDGPVYGPTEFALDELSKSSAKATFFCIGDNVRKHPDVFRRIVFEGHAVGNHTFNHLSGWSTETETYLDNIRKFETESAKALANEKRKNALLFRPPYGRIKFSQVKALSDYKIIMWDVLSLDYDKSISPEKCLRNTLSAIRPGSIVVFHDSLKAEKNMTFVLPRLVSALKEKGFEFKSLGL
jgi:peptidoglycan-N-acetylglucosamine deacetylase